MDGYKTLDKETVLAELRFAIEHKIEFFTHCVDELLHPIDVQDICNKLKIQAETHASFITDTMVKRAYYTLEFYKKNEITKNSIGTYFGIDLVSSANDKEFEPEEEQG